MWQTPKSTFWIRHTWRQSVFLMWNCPWQHNDRAVCNCSITRCSDCRVIFLVRVVDLCFEFCPYNKGCLRELLYLLVICSAWATSSIMVKDIKIMSDSMWLSLSWRLLNTLWYLIIKFSHFLNLLCKYPCKIELVFMCQEVAIQSNADDSLAHGRSHCSLKCTRIQFLFVMSISCLKQLLYYLL